MGRRPSKPRSIKRFVVGITGRMLSGKKEVASVLVSKGFFLVDVDKIGHQVLEIRKETIARKISKSIINENGEVDRKRLAQIVFDDPVKLDLLNRLTHGTIKEIVRNEINRSGFICIEAALLFEIGLDEFCDLIVYVDSSDENILSRAKLRGFSEEDVKKRLSFQKKLSDVSNKVDIVLDNNGTLEDLKREIENKIMSIVKI